MKRYNLKVEAYSHQSVGKNLFQTEGQANVNA